MAKPGQNAGVRMPKTRPFHDAPVPLGLGSVGRPTACHHFSPTDQLVGGGQEDDGETPQDRLGHSHFSHGQVLGPQVLKMHLIIDSTVRAVILLDSGDTVSWSF